MKEVTTTIRLFEKGDRVLTPEGTGTVKENEELRVSKQGDLDRLDFAYSDSEVELDEPCSSFGRRGRMETALLLLETT